MPMLKSGYRSRSEKYPFFKEEKDIAPIPLRIVERKTDEDWLTESQKEWKILFEEEKHRLPV
jgi:hypothetical protein